MAEPSTLHTEDLNKLPLNGQSIKETGRPSAGRPSMESYTGGKKASFADASLLDYYRERCSRLEDDLHDSDRKVRQHLDEIMQLRRDLSKDHTETMLTHQTKISDLKEANHTEIERLKETHRRDIKEFERQIAEMERQAFKMELEQRTGDRTASNRILDMLEDAAPTLFEHISGVISGAITAQGHAGLPASTDLPQQQAELLQQAFDQDMETAKRAQEIPKSDQSMTPNNGEGGDTPHRSGQRNEEPIGLNDFFAGKANGHHDHAMEGN